MTLSRTSEACPSPLHLTNLIGGEILMGTERLRIKNSNRKIQISFLTLSVSPSPAPQNCRHTNSTVQIFPEFLSITRCSQIPVLPEESTSQASVFVMISQTACKWDMKVFYLLFWVLAAQAPSSLCITGFYLQRKVSCRCKISTCSLEGVVVTPLCVSFLVTVVIFLLQLNRRKI